MRLASSPKEIWRMSGLRSMSGASTPVDMARWACGTGRSPMPMPSENESAPIHCVSMDRAKRGRLGEARSEGRDHFGQRDTHRAPIIFSLYVGGEGYPIIWPGRCPTERPLTLHRNSVRFCRTGL